LCRRSPAKAHLRRSLHPHSADIRPGTAGSRSLDSSIATCCPGFSGEANARRHGGELASRPCTPCLARPLVFSCPSAPGGREEHGSCLLHRPPLSSPFSSTVSSSLRWTITATRTDYDFLRSLLSIANVLWGNVVIPGKSDVCPTFVVAPGRRPWILLWQPYPCAGTGQAGKRADSERVALLPASSSHQVPATKGRLLNVRDSS
jgi:hypothetical protein